MKRLLALILTASMLLSALAVDVFAEDEAVATSTNAQTVSSTAAQIPDDAVEFNGHYYKVYNESVTWNEAKDLCENLGGHLVTITSSEEQTAVEDMLELGAKKQYWIGLRKVEGVLKWVTDESVGYTNWDNQEPNNTKRSDGSVEEYIQIYNQYNPARYRSARFKWNDIYYDNTFPGEESFFSLQNVGYICEWGNVVIGKHYAPGYNPEIDRYSFRNIVDVVDEKIYVDIYGEEKGTALYRKYELTAEGKKDPHGLCYGMATTTAGYLMDVPRVNTVINSGFLDFVWNVGERQTISEIKKTDLCTTMNLISVRTFIKYAFAIQCATVLDRNNRDCDDIYDAVYDYVFNDGVPVTIDLYVTDYDSNHKEVDTPFAHTVLAVGLDGDNGIIVDDSNCDDLTTIRFEKDQNGNFNGKWSYDVYPELINGNNNHVVNNRYVSVMYHTQMASVWADAVLQNITVLDSDWVSGESTENAVWGVKKYKSDYNLVIVDSDEHQIKSSSENGLSEIAPIMSGDSNTSNDKAKLYWSYDADQLTIDGVDGGEVSVIGNKNVITSNLSKDECATITLDERNGNVSTEIDAGADGIYNLNLKTSDQGKKTFMLFDGTTDAGSVNITKTNVGATIEGSGTATLTIMEGDSVKASEEVEHSGYVGVKYDEVKEEIQTYLVGDANGDSSTNIIDLTLSAQYIAQGGISGKFDLSECYVDAMDANGDGVIGQLDLNAIAAIIRANA